MGNSLKFGKWLARTLDAKGQLVSDDRRAKNYLMSLPGMTPRQLKKHRRAGRQRVICECMVCRNLPISFRRKQLDQILAAERNLIDETRRNYLVGRKAS